MYVRAHSKEPFFSFRQDNQYEMPVIGEEDWDAVILVEYPSRASFLKMVSDEEYQAAGQYRTEALIDSRLFVTKPINPVYKKEKI